jgi:cytochrome c553
MVVRNMLQLKATWPSRLMGMSIWFGLALAGHAALAQPPSQTPPPPPAKAAVCAACHGPDGNSINPIWPNLAGQHATYLQRQLEAYKSGQRANPIMAGNAAALTAEDITQVAAYFSQLPAKAAQADPALLDQGKSLYRAGKMEGGMPACAACHGPDGSGNAPAAFPRLAGQHAPYTALQLRAYRDGTRAGTAQAKIMTDIAKGLTDQDIEAVASYVQGLQTLQPADLK